MPTKRIILILVIILTIASCYIKYTGTTNLELGRNPALDSLYKIESDTSYIDSLMY